MRTSSSLTHLALGCSVITFGMSLPPVARVVSARGLMSASVAATSRARFSPCQPAALTAIARLSAITEALSGAVVLRNRSSTECTLHGYPYVQLVDARGYVAPTILVHGRSGSQVPPATAASDQRIGLVRPGRRAFFYITWSSWCSRRQLRRPIALRIRLPGTTKRLDVRVHDNQPGAVWETTPGCEVGPSPSYLGVGALEILAPGHNP
jgi:hypothetical protein